MRVQRDEERKRDGRGSPRQRWEDGGGARTVVVDLWFSYERN